MTVSISEVKRSEEEAVREKRDHCGIRLYVLTGSCETDDTDKVAEAMVMCHEYTVKKEKKRQG